MNFQLIPIAEASVTSLMAKISEVIINPLINFLMVLALVYFIYGLVRYLLSPDNEEIRKSSKKHMLWGVIGLCIMVSAFGIMRFILKTIGEDGIKIGVINDNHIEQIL